MPRKSKYDRDAVIAEICDRLSKGETLRSICRDKHMPAWQAVYQWVDDDEDFARRIARAREIGFDAIAEEALDIANTPVIGVREEKSVDGYKVIKEDMLGHRKLQIETRLKLLSKWSPKKYGERQHLEHSGKVGLESLIADDE
jgi:hypothetical protein